MKHMLSTLLKIKNKGRHYSLPTFVHLSRLLTFLSSLSQSHSDSIPYLSYPF